MSRRLTESDHVLDYVINRAKFEGRPGTFKADITADCSSRSIPISTTLQYELYNEMKDAIQAQKTLTLTSHTAWIQIHVHVHCIDNKKTFDYCEDPSI